MLYTSFFFSFFFFNDTATTEIYTLSLHDALPISTTRAEGDEIWQGLSCETGARNLRRSEEHTSELQSPCNLVCRLLLEKKKKNIILCQCQRSALAHCRRHLIVSLHLSHPSAAEYA